MASLDRNLRRDLENAVKKARRVAEAGARQAMEQLAVGHHEPWSALTPDQRRLRNRLRAHGRQLGDRFDERKGTQTIDRLTGECAYEHWHRLLFARFLAENDLLVEPESGMALSLDECRELARERAIDWLLLASDFAQRMLPQIFRAGDPVLEVPLPPEKRQDLEAILERLPHDVFVADDSVGWVYQFWQTEQKDAVNASGNKIGADELPAVTQLFTEDYMVLFLLHNTLGAWWAGKVLAARPELARAASTEGECRAACALPGVEWSYLRFVRENDVWRPAAGTFPGWPNAAKAITVLDPCMGSGHFLAFALPMLVALRREEEKLSLAEAVDAVLRDNLFGLELDLRCTQIAAFNVGFTAWKLAGYRPLPALNLACAGLGINAPVTAWTALAAGDALAENAMKQLYELFRQAPTLGSLIDPTRVGGELFVTHFDKIRSLLSAALASEQSEDAEIAVVARGIAGAAHLLSEHYTLVVTNVPYLVRIRQAQTLVDWADKWHADSRLDLATMFIERLLAVLEKGGTLAAVAPLNWGFLDKYKKFRRRLLRDFTWSSYSRLGAGAFEQITGEVVSVGLYVLTNTTPSSAHAVRGVDANETAGRSTKVDMLRAGRVASVLQESLISGVDARIGFAPVSPANLLAAHADSFHGISTTDYARLGRCFWEVDLGDDRRRRWILQQSTVQETRLYGGREHVLRWDDGDGALSELRRQGAPVVITGTEAWGKRGVAVSQMGALPVTLYDGQSFDDNTAVIVPKKQEHLTAIWAFCSSSEFKDAIRSIDSSIKVTYPTMVKVEFDLGRWLSAGKQLFPEGVPPPHSDDPTQWVFPGIVNASSAPLQVAVARLLGYQWPRQSGAALPGASTVGDDGLTELADNDGIVCLPALRGESPAADRVRAVLARAHGGAWSAELLSELLTGVSASSLEEWLRNGFFSQHCELFDQRPFIWHVWDGLPNGFSALVKYQQLAAPNGEGRRTLEKLTHTYLGDWLDRQRAGQKAGIEGADGRVAAAEHLKRELEKILEGEPPYDIFVRWKPLHQQPVGWEPDADDGVRVNIRPFMTANPLNARGKNACILRVAPKIRWEKDRGKEPARERTEFPWFWGWDEETHDFMGGSAFDGNRWNDLHYTRAVKLAARKRAKAGKS